MQPIQHRSRAQRGASIIEALVVLAMLAALLAVGIHFHHKYDGAVSRAADARSVAWTTAMAGCKRNRELQNDLAGLLQQVPSINPRVPAPSGNLLILRGAPELNVHGLSAESTMAAPCNELAQGTGTPISQLQEPLVRRLLGSR